MSVHRWRSVSTAPTTSRRWSDPSPVTLPGTTRILIEADPTRYIWKWAWTAGGQFVHLFPYTETWSTYLVDTRSLCGGANLPFMLADRGWLKERNYCLNCVKRWNKAVIRKAVR